MVTLKELQRACRKVVETKRAFVEAELAVDKLISELPEVKALRNLWEQWEKAQEDFENMWLKK